MVSILLDSDNDLSIENNSLQLVEGEDEVAQKIKTVLQTIRGECFLDTSKGIPYLTEVVGKNKNYNLISALIIDEIKSIESVETIDSFNIELKDNRILAVTAKINGTIEVNVEI